MSKKNKVLVFIAGILGFSLAFIGCSSDGSSSNSEPDVVPGTLGSAEPALIAASKVSVSAEDVILFYYRPDGDYKNWGLWLWEGSGDGQLGYDATIGKAAVTTVEGITIGYWNISQLCSSVSQIKTGINGNKDLGFIIRNEGWTKDPGTDQKMTLSTSKHFMVLSGDTGVYEVSDNISPTITSAVSISKTQIRASLSVSYGLQLLPDSNGFTVESDSEICPVIDVVNYDNKLKRNKNNARNVLITLGSNMDSSKNWVIKHNLFNPKNGCSVSVQGAAKESPVYDGNDLGLTLDENKAIFKTWAPIASDVKLLVYENSDAVGNFNAASIAAKSVGQLTDSELKGNPADIFQMRKDSDSGVWSYTCENVSSYKYYKYQITNSGVTYYVSDIWSKAVSPDAIASQIVDINKSSEAIPTGRKNDTVYGETGYYNPFEGSKNSDAVIYEMHITDWSYAEDSSAGNVGKYLTIANGSKVIKHIQEMGITHVQLLPVFEFAETNDNTGYNWGYNPYHYNAPEGRYTTEGYKDGTQAVKELRELVAAFHDAGIAVIMDVVYNHTNGTLSGSLYDSTVPYYFYRFADSGEYSNGSGCGNEVDTEAPMGKKYIIESLKHWMQDYHFNGFRFDLMGCISKETMKEIYDELYKIDPKVMIYGEPWTGGTSEVKNGTVQAVNSSPYGVGAFDDDFRDAIKGAEFDGFKQGQVQGTFNDADIVNGLIGKSGKNKRNETGKPELSLHYVECHDNYTLFDKLAISYLGKTNAAGDLFSKIGVNGLVTVKKQDTLAAAYVMLSQGTAFINGGQEFLRTKRGDENSYKSPIGKNGINLDFAATYSDVCNTYKGLIALRQTNLESFGSGSRAAASTVSEGVTKYTTGDFCVYFNATDNAVKIDASGYAKSVDVSSGTPTEGAVAASVPAKSFVILKK